MVAALSNEPAVAEQRLLVHGITWQRYEALRELLDESGLLLTYCEGALELMSPSRPHEGWKKSIARLVELYAHLRRIDLYGYGSTTFKSEAKARGLEPDECYCVGEDMGDVPQIALEVVYSNPLLDKLKVYAGLGVAEVWTFRDAAFTVHALDASTGTYRVAERSQFLPELDFAVVATLAMRSDLPQALRDFEALLATL